MPLGSSRVLRVFVSSTFRDMHAEREELVKRIFPQLRKLCESRGVSWSEIDLRWGVTDEEKAEGKVLPICLAEIQNCRPYFIGLLGERYGWVPDTIDPTLAEQEPWLDEHREKSVTELEILHGVLNDPEMSSRAFFYLRSPDYIESLPAQEREKHREQPDPGEIASLGSAEAERRAEERRRRLAALKQRLRGSALPVRDDYPDPRTLGTLVREDLTALIDRLYPAGSELDPLDREAAEHEAFAASRARVYIGRREYVDRLDAHAEGNGPPLVVVGESGGGKSALLANWALARRGTHPDELVLMHFVGASAFSANWAGMVRRIVGELERRFHFGLEIPEQPQPLRDAFAEVLSAVASRERLVLVLDALNQLEDEDGAPDLVWLPAEIPSNVRLIVSTLPGRPLDELTRRGWPTVEVQPLQPGEKERLVVEYLSRSRKRLSASQVQRIVRAPQAASPLYLVALLEELRVWGDHFRLDERIEHFLSAETVDDLYERILGRYEADYDRDRADLVRDAMSLIWAARRGLSEAELLDLLGSGEAPLPAAYWSPLFLATEQALVSRSGLMSFSHAHVRKAVADRYLGDEGAEQLAHLRLGEYFLRRPLAPELESPDGSPDLLRQRPDLRKIDEQAWQFFEARADAQLKATLTDVSIVVAITYLGRYEELLRYWRGLGDTSSIVDSYRPQLQRFKETNTTEDYVTALNTIGHLYADLGHGPDAANALEEAVNLLKDTDAYMSFSTANSYANLGVLLNQLGRSEEAEEAFTTARAITEQLAPRSLLSVRELNNLTSLHLAQGETGKAEAMCRSSLAVLDAQREHGGSSLATAERARALANWSRILAHKNDRSGAIATSEEALRLAQATDHARSELPLILYRLAGQYSAVAELRKAADALERAARLLDEERVAPDREHQAAVTARLAQTKLQLDDVESATGLLARLSALMRNVATIGDSALIEGITGLARELQSRRLLAHAEQVSIDAIDLLERAGRTGSRDHAALLCDVSALCSDQEKHDLAVLHAQRAWEAVRGSGDAVSIIAACRRFATARAKTGDVDGAREVLREGREGAQLAGATPAQLGIVLQALGDLCAEHDLWSESESAYREAVSVYSSAGGPVDAHALGRCLTALGGALEKTQRNHEAEACYLRAIELGEVDPRHGELLATTLSNYALLLNELDRDDEAIALHDRVLAMRKDSLGTEHELVGRTLSYLGLSHFKRGELDGARSMFGQALSIFRSALGDEHAKTQELVLTLQLLGGTVDVEEAAPATQTDAAPADSQGPDVATPMPRIVERAPPKEAPAEPAVAEPDDLAADADANTLQLQREEERCRREGDRPGLAASLARRAEIAHEQGDLELEASLLDEVEAIWRELEQIDRLVADLGNSASILEARGDGAGAIALLKRQERLYRERGDGAGLQACLAAQALQTKQLGDLDGAVALLTEQQRVCREIGAAPALERSLRHQAAILRAQLPALGELGVLISQGFGEPDARGEGQLPDHREQLKAAFEARAETMRDSGELQRAEELLRRLERIERELGNRTGVELCLRYRLVTLTAIGRDLRGQAMVEWFEEQERILEELGEDRSLQLTRANKSMQEGFVLEESGRFSDAIATYKHAEEIYERTGLSDALNFCLECQLKALQAQMRQES